MRKDWLEATVATAVLLFGVACDGKKADECTAIQTAATKDVAALKAAAAVKPASTKELADAARATADAADKLAADLAKKGPTTAELQKSSGDYQAVAKAISVAARNHADDLDHVAAMESKVRADGADADVKTLTADRDKVKQRCAEHPAPECRALTTLTANITPMVKKPELLDKLESDVGGVNVKDAALAPLVASLRGSITGLAKTLRDATDAAIEIKSLQAKAKASSDALDAALAKEAPVTASLAAFCGGGGGSAK